MIFNKKKYHPNLEKKTKRGFTQIKKLNVPKLGLVEIYIANFNFNLVVWN